MNAAVSSPASPRTSGRSSTRARKVAPKARSTTHAAIAELAIETTSKLVVSTVLGCVAIVSLGTLIPLAQLNTAKLKELSRELKATQTRVAYQQGRFNQHFDPLEARNVEQDVQYRIDRQEIPIIEIKQ